MRAAAQHDDGHDPAGAVLLFEPGDVACIQHLQRLCQGTRQCITQCQGAGAPDAGQGQHAKPGGTSPVAKKSTSRSSNKNGMVGSNRAAATPFQAAMSSW